MAFILFPLPAAILVAATSLSGAGTLLPRWLASTGLPLLALVMVVVTWIGLAPRTPMGRYVGAAPHLGVRKSLSSVRREPPAVVIPPKLMRAHDLVIPQPTAHAAAKTRKGTLMTSMRTRIARLTIASGLALCLVGALAGNASAAVSSITIDSSAQLSPGHLHVTLTGTVTCDPGTTASLSGKVISRSASGLGYTEVACDGTPQAYAIDVSSPTFPPTVFRAGKATAQVSSMTCGLTWPCTTIYTDATIRLVK